MPNIVLYTRGNHLESGRARQLLRERGLQFEEVDVAEDVRLAELVERTGGAGGFPQLLIDGYRISGWRELQRLYETGVLENMLGDASVSYPGS
jgi:glutaredoxin